MKEKNPCEHCGGLGYDPYPNHDTTMRPCPMCSEPPVKDKTYYIEHNGEMLRVMAGKKPSKGTVKALKAMADAVKKRFTNE